MTLCLWEALGTRHGDKKVEEECPAKFTKLTSEVDAEGGNPIRRRVACGVSSADEEIV